MKQTDINRMIDDLARNITSMHPMSVLIDHEYHIVELNGWRMPDEVLVWLHENYGLGDGKIWMYKHPKVYFANPRDHLMFLLKWG